MNQIETAQYVADEYTNWDKKVVKVFFADPFECCIVFENDTCSIVTGLFAQRIKSADLT